MTLRAALVGTSLVCLLSIPALASQPQGLAGRFMTNQEPPADDLLCTPYGLEWYQSLGVFPPSDTVTLDLAIIPFPHGTTFIGMDEEEGGTFFVVSFADGLVEGLPYRRRAWNDVSIQLRFATQDFLMTVNGVQGGPFPFSSFCADEGRCAVAQAWRLNEGDDVPGGSVMWLDSLSVQMELPDSTNPVYTFTASPCDYPPVVSGGGVVFAHPPRTRSSSTEAGSTTGRRIQPEQ